MGQAQLLLIVLGVVLVGIAIVAGIQAYDANNRKASVDALTHDALRLASDVQLWAQKPVQFGGPATRGDASGVVPNDLGYAGDLATDPVVNTNGECVITGADWSAGAAAADGTVVCTNAALGTSATVTISGLADTDLEVTDTQMGI